MLRSALILVEGSRGNGPLYVQAAERLGLHPITLSRDPGRYDYLAAEGMEAIRVDTDSLDALIRECSQLGGTYDIAGISGFPTPSESVCATAARLCRYFDLPGPDPESIERCCDKFVQRQFLSKAGVPIPAFRLAENARDVASAATEIGLPVILKPAIGINSSGVRLCRDLNEVAEHATYLLGGKKHIWRSSPRILIEEFAQGPHYIAHTMGNEVIGIEVADFDRPPHFVFREGMFPAPLTDDEHERIADVSRGCLRALGLTWGPANIELRWTKLGPVVIEVNPRLAITPLSVKLAYGVDLVTEHIKRVIGDEWDLGRKHSYIAVWRSLLPDRDGILDWINGGSQAAALPGVAQVKLYVEPKAPIIRNGDGRDCLGHINVVSPTPAEAEAILQRAADLIEWSITPFTSLGEQQEAAGPPTSLHQPGGAMQLKSIAQH
ncbi:acetyl-CoA carboxylase biotin carboxylase subunit family protein [Rhizobium lentis]|uniref:Biotin carboxylase n=1 Tax=Rhizobium lentis TaxID=1138194 RepID=A0A7W8XK23_9HYPH|nr:acetyl-CoA carboxylase biotin carboxylase subunit family protein [Rhizobium lentis]MBB4577208.1 biotin carboxylase [Rhizobium lentis]MBB5553771.1 biotin carboxylase [Rhizobium lentis]MBB5564332.1 biotin carboxylase [Rhizobium lentis]MBB5570868.1 biotin carboxylase [Rhizobium lentis]